MGLQEKLDGIYARLDESKICYRQAQAYYESNRCTKYYFKLPGMKKDSIKSLYNASGDRIYSQKQILIECQKYYQQLYQQSPLVTNTSLQQKYLNKIPRNLLSQSGETLLVKTYING